MRHKITVTAADCIRETFRGSGAGGQNRNKRDTGVRYRHPPSGAVGESCEQRSQVQNAREAFRKMSSSAQFRAWAGLRLQAREEGYDGIERKVDEMMRADNLKIESKGSCLPDETYCDKSDHDR